MTSTTAPAAVGRRWWLAVFAACGVAAITLTWLDIRDAWFAPKDEFKVWVQLLIYWGCWTVWPASVMLAWSALARWRQGLRRQALWALVGLIGCALLVWMRFIEPSLLVVREASVSSTCGVRVALISDLHLGIYGRTHDLDRLVDRLNTLEVDAVLIAGDITVEPPRDLVRMLAPLKRLRHRTLSVTGNHDEQHPGAPLTQALRDALTSVNVRSIEGQRVPLGSCELLGMGDLRSGSASGDLFRLRTHAAMSGAVDAAHRVVLVHDPDTATFFPKNFAGLVLAGHTHGGQIDLPWLTDRLLHAATRGHFRRGLYTLPMTRVFVTSGVGMSKLPLRFRVWPVIDVLEL